MKFGTKIHQLMEKLVKLISKIVVKSHFKGGTSVFCSLCLLVKKKMSNFCISNS